MSLQEIETSLTRSLTTITTHWDHMLTPRSSGSIARGSGATVTLADDHADTDADTPRLERLLSLRREVTDCLNSWARVIIEDRDIRVQIPHGTDTLGMCAFIERHTQWFAGHEAAEEAAGELRVWAGKVRTAAAAPEVGGDRDEIIIRTVNAGKCPTAINRGEHAIYGTPLMRCDTTVRLPLAQPEDTVVTCAGCGTDDTVEGWTARIIGNPEPLTTRALIAFLHERLGMTVTPIAVRLWQHKGMIEPLSKTESGHNLYDGYKVLRALRERDERRLGIHEETA